MIVAEVLFLLVVFGVFPVAAARGFPLALRRIAEGQPGARVAIYRETMQWQWPLAGVAVILWGIPGRSLADLGFRAPSGPGFWAAAAVAAVAAALLTQQLRQVRRDEAAAAELRTQLGGHAAFLPRHDDEGPTAIALSVTAGVCEEILYRGWLLGVVSPWIGVPATVGLGIVGFGAAHAYAGRTLALRAGATGALFWALFLVSGSLWVPIALHVFLDWNMTLTSRAAFRHVSRPAVNP